MQWRDFFQPQNLLSIVSSVIAVGNIYFTVVSNRRNTMIDLFRDHEKEIQDVRFRWQEFLSQGDVSQDQIEFCYEMFLNAFESFCASYLAREINQNRFEKEYKKALQQIFNDDYLRRKIVFGAFPSLTRTAQKLGVR